MLDPNPSQSMTPGPPIFYRKGNRHRNTENLLLSTYILRPHEYVFVPSFVPGLKWDKGPESWHGPSITYAINYVLVISILILIN